MNRFGIPALLAVAAIVAFKVGFFVVWAVLITAAIVAVVVAG